MCFLIISLISTVSGGNILILNPTIGHSHVKFLGNFGDLLVQDGHNVTILSPVWDANVELHGSSSPNITKIEFHSPYLTLDFWSQLDVKSASFWDYPETNGFTLTWEETTMFYTAYKYTYQGLLEDKDLMERLQDSHFDLAVAEFFEQGNLGFFEILGIKATICASTVGMIGFHYEIMQLPMLSSFIPGYLTTFDAEMTFWDRLNNIWIEHDIMSYSRESNRNLDALFKQYKPDILPVNELMKLRTGVILSNTNEFTESPRPTTNLIQYIGGINVHAPKPLSPEINSLLALRPSTVLFSFGTYIKGCQMPLKLKLELLEAFSLFPNVTFLWKYEDSCEDDGTPFEKYPNVIHRPWWPQSDLLGDPRLKAFITHGGMNSMLELSFRGKPAIVVPLIGDQYLNAKVSVKIGKSVTIKRTELSKNRMVEALEKVLKEDGEIVQKAKMTAAVLEGRNELYKKEALRRVRLVLEFGPMDHHRLPTNHLNFFQLYHLDIYLFLASLGAILLSILTISFRFTLRLLSKSSSGKEKSS